MSALNPSPACMDANPCTNPRLFAEADGKATQGAAGISCQLHRGRSLLSGLFAGPLPNFVTNLAPPDTTEKMQPDWWAAHADSHSACSTAVDGGAGYSKGANNLRSLGLFRHSISPLSAASADRRLLTTPLSVTSVTTSAQIETSGSLSPGKDHRVDAEPADETRQQLLDPDGSTELEGVRNPSVGAAKSGLEIGQVVLHQLMQLQNAYYNACATLVLGVLLFLGYLNVQLVGSYFTALVAALLTGLMLRQPKLAVEKWLKYEGVAAEAAAGVAAEQTTSTDSSCGSGTEACECQRESTAGSTGGEDEKSGRLFRVLSGLYMAYFGYGLLSASPFMAMVLVIATAVCGVLHRVLRLMRPLWQAGVHYPGSARVYEPGQWWADPYQLVYEANASGVSGSCEPIWPHPSHYCDLSRSRSMHSMSPRPPRHQLKVVDGTIEWVAIRSWDETAVLTSLWRSPHLVLGLPLYTLRMRVSRSRQALATCIVVGCVGVGSLLFFLYFIIAIIDEANYFRLLVTDPDPAMWPAIVSSVGVSEEQFAAQLANSTANAKQAVVDYGRSLVGDPDLAAELEKLIRTTIREYHLYEATHSSRAPRNLSSEQCSPRTSPGNLTHRFNFELSLDRVVEVIAHSTDRDQAIALASKLSSQVLSGLGLIFRILFSTIDYFFSFSLYVSWVWVFISSRDDLLQSLASLLVADPSVQADIYRVGYFSVQVVLGGLARSFIFHAATAWLIFTLFDVTLLHIGSLLAGFMALLPIGSPWLVIWMCPLWRWTTGRWVYSHEAWLWVAIFVAHLKLDTTTITHVHIARAKYISASMAGQSILLAYYAFGSTGVILGPLIVSTTVGILKIIKRSVVEPLQHLSDLSMDSEICAAIQREQEVKLERTNTVAFVTQAPPSASPRTTYETASGRPLSRQLFHTRSH